MRNTVWSLSPFGERVYRKLSALVKNDSFDGVKAMFDATQKAVTAVDASCKLYMFGSTVAFGFHEKGSDVDFVALREQDTMVAPRCTAAPRHVYEEQLHFLHTLRSVMRPLLPTAVVRPSCGIIGIPVLRAKRSQNCGGFMEVDVTAFCARSLRNSVLLRSYMEQLPLARWLCMIVKRWSKEVGLNASGEGGCVTSYGFNIMVVYYLLRSGLVKFVPPESISFSTIEPFPTELPLEPLTDAAVEELEKLLIGFFEFYAEMCATSGASVTLRSEKDSLTSQMPPFEFCIEDPYVMMGNLTHRMSRERLHSLWEAMNRSAAVLSKW